MRRFNPPKSTVSLLDGHPRERFADAEARGAHLAEQGVFDAETFPVPVKIATEGGRLAGTFAPSDDAEQFDVGDNYALYWIYFERLVRKPPCGTVRLLSRVDPPRPAQGGARFDDVCGAGTGFAGPDCLLSGCPRSRTHSSESWIIRKRRSFLMSIRFRPFAAPA